MPAPVPLLSGAVLVTAVPVPVSGNLSCSRLAICWGLILRCRPVPILQEIIPAAHAASLMKALPAVGLHMARSRRSSLVKFSHGAQRKALSSFRSTRRVSGSVLTSPTSSWAVSPPIADYQSRRTCVEAIKAKQRLSSLQ